MSGTHQVIIAAVVLLSAALIVATLRHFWATKKAEMERNELFNLVQEECRRTIEAGEFDKWRWLLAEMNSVTFDQHAAELYFGRDPHTLYPPGIQEIYFRELGRRQGKWSEKSST